MTLTCDDDDDDDDNESGSILRVLERTGTVVSL
jgi:hypothetical protein